MTALVHSRWLSKLALGALVIYLLVAIPVALRNTWLRARAAGATLRQSPAALRARVFGQAYTAAIEDIRRQIPEDEPYILSTTGDMAAMLWVRFDLLPRRAFVPELRSRPCRRAEVLGGADSLDRARDSHGPSPHARTAARAGAAWLPARTLEVERAMTLASAGANLGGIALFGLPGLGLAELFAALRRLPLARRLGYAYLLGIVALAGGLFALGHGFGMRLTRPSILIIAFAPLAAGIAHRAWNRTARASTSARPLRVGLKRPAWYLWARLVLGAVVLGPCSPRSPPARGLGRSNDLTPLAVAMRHETTVDPSV